MIGQFKQFSAVFSICRKCEICIAPFVLSHNNTSAADSEHNPCIELAKQKSTNLQSLTTFTDSKDMSTLKEGKHLLPARKSLSVVLKEARATGTRGKGHVKSL